MIHNRSRKNQDNEAAFSVLYNREDSVDIDRRVMGVEKGEKR